MSGDVTKKAWLHCASCGHTWGAAQLPMEASEFCKRLAMAKCPQCGNTRDLFMANEAQVAAAAQKAA